VSVLIDKLIDGMNSCHVELVIDGKKGWYIAKPLCSSFSFRKLFKKLKDCISILNGKSFAVHYKEDMNE